MRRRTVLLTTAAGLLAPAGVPLPAAAAAPGAPTGGAAPTGPQLQRLLEAEQRAGMPGLFAEVRDGRTRWPLAAGVADLDTGRPVRPWFQHRVGSITKTFVATTVLQLVGERRVRLDAPIGQYLPDVVAGPRGRQITVRMLLNHTSGIGNYTTALLGNPDDIARAAGHTFTPRDLATVGLIMAPTNAPGALWSYSNTNYIILGLLIERLTRRPYAAEIERRILRPLGLRDTYFPGTEPRIRGPHAAAYLSWVDGSLRDFSVFNMSWAWAAGELVSTPADLNTFYRALLTGRLLAPPLLREMQTTVPFDPAQPEAAGYGLGLFSVALPC
ncbi:MAG TPA: serine hydrolase domain-containing protein, partial [Catenuloplanes sp.]